MVVLQDSINSLSITKSDLKSVSFDSYLKTVPICVDVIRLVIVQLLD